MRKKSFYYLLVFIIMFIFFTLHFFIKSESKDNEEFLFDDKKTTNNLSCTMYPPALPWLKAGASTTITLECKSSEKFSRAILTSSSFIVSDTDVINVSSPIRFSINNGFKYVIPITAKKQGKVKLTLKEGMLSVISNKKNDAISSNEIIVDMTPPDIKLNKKSGTYSTDQSLTISASDIGGSEFSAMWVHVYKNGVMDSTKSVNSYTKSNYTINLEKGSYWNVNVIVHDKAGNKQNLSPSNDYGWYYQDYDLTGSKNLFTGLDDVSDTTNNNGIYSIKNKIITVKAKKDDGFVYTNVKANLVAKNEYMFLVETNGIWGGADDTVEAFLMLDGKNTKYYRMSSDKYIFIPDTSGEYTLRLDVNKKGKQYTFSNIKIVELSKNNSNNEAGPTVNHQHAGKWDYKFTYGMQSLNSTLLTNFKDGNKGTGDGIFNFDNNGLSIKVNSSSYADSYNIYNGANLLTADYSNVKYIGIEITNNEANDIYIGLQGFDKNKSNIFLSNTGSNILLASSNSDIKIAKGQDKIFNRYCIIIPAKFNGTILIPTDRIVDNVTSDAKKWLKTPIDSLGFHFFDPKSGTNGILIKSVFIYDKELKIENSANDNYNAKTRIAPFWKLNTIYNESLAMIEDDNGNIYGTLLFVPTKIISVKDVYLQKEYVAGKDYIWDKGTNKIKWLTGSNIEYFTEAMLSGEGLPIYPTFDKDNKTNIGRLYTVGPYLYKKQIAVTYEYDKNSVKTRNIKYTQYQGNKLKSVVNKLNNNKDLNILFYGDSIFAGYDASSMYNREPNNPKMHELIRNELQNYTSGTVKMDNLSVGGWTVQNGYDALNGNVTTEGYTYNYSKKYKNNYDLLIMSFGMNNANTNEKEYKDYIIKIINKIKDGNPNIEIILVSCMNPNPNAIGWDVNQKYQGQWLKEIADKNGYAIVDFYAVHKSILKYKNFVSTSGNNINHPNDWLIRVYAQNILATMLDYDELYK